MSFSNSPLATRLLAGLSGLEIGGAAHNSFNLNTLNLDINNNPVEDTAYRQEQIRNCGKVMKVDILGQADRLPFRDNSFDFIISSHMIEHAYDPISTIFEWGRVARKYLYFIVPHKERTFDRDRDVTPLATLIARYNNRPNILPEEEGVVAPGGHFSVWTTKEFVEMIKYINLKVIATQDVDDKVGNGFAVVVKLP